MQGQQQYGKIVTQCTPKKVSSERVTGNCNIRDNVYPGVSIWHPFSLHILPYRAWTSCLLQYKTPRASTSKSQYSYTSRSRGKHKPVTRCIDSERSPKYMVYSIRDVVSSPLYSISFMAAGRFYCMKQIQFHDDRPWAVTIYEGWSSNDRAKLFTCDPRLLDYMA